MFTLGLIFASAPGLAMTEAPAETAPLPVLQLDRNGLHYPASAIELLQTPDWAKPIVMRAMELHTPA